MKYFKKILAAAMALAMVLSLASCKKDPSQGGSEIDNAMTVAPMQVSDPDRGEEKIKAAASDYDFVFRKLSVDRSYAYDVTAKEIASAKAADMLLSNQVSVASLNLEDAVRVAAQTDVIFLAATTETRLSLVTNDENVKDIKGLRGKTVYCGGKDTFAQTVTEKIFDDNGVNAELVFLSDSEVIEKVKNNESDLFILQEPEGLVAIAQNENYIRAFELTEYWKEEFRPVGRCVVVKADFAKANPELIKELMTHIETCTNSLASETGVLYNTLTFIEEGVFTGSEFTNNAITATRHVFCEKEALRNLVTANCAVAGYEIADSDGLYYMG